MLRLIQRTAGQHKLWAPWEGPFVVSKALGNGSYYLIDAQKTKSMQERRLRQGVGATMERKPPKTILQLKSSMYHATFCIKYKTTGPPRSTRGLPSFKYV